MRDVDRTAIMTSNITPAPNAVSASSEWIHDPGCTASAAFNKETSRGWSTDANVHAGWLLYDFGVRKWIPKGYRIIGSWNGRDMNPKSWIFEGSNDGVHFDVLDTQNNVDWGPSQPPYGDKTFHFTNRKMYRYCRINISTNVSGVAQINITEMYIYASKNNNNLRIGQI